MGRGLRALNGARASVRVEMGGDGGIARPRT